METWPIALHGFDSQRYIYPYIRWKHGQSCRRTSEEWRSILWRVIRGQDARVWGLSLCHCYEGSWHEGRKQGFGMYTFRNGEARSGEWDYGVLKNLLPLTNIDVQRVVQAARKAAEKAMLIPWVEEQVSKVVAATNRAANAARVAAIKVVQNRMDGKFCDLDV